MPQVLIVVGRVLVLAILGYFALIFALQRRMAFPGTLRSSTRPTASAPPDVTQVWLEASFGRVEAWFFNAEGDVHRPTIIFAHGNGELIEDWYGDMEHLAAAGANVLLVEFPGYGHSRGKPSRSTLRETFTLAFDWLIARDDMIPYAHAETLAAARDGLAITELDCAHNDCAPEWPQIVVSLTAFLRSHALLDR